MNEYDRLSKAVRDELETIKNNENYDKVFKQKPVKNSFWQKLGINIISLLKKTP